MIAAIYARYSSEERQRDTSLRDQIAMCRAAAARFGCQIADEHVYTDEGLPGSVIQRPGYQGLMAAARGRVFDAIVVEDQDRLWRSQAEMHAALVRLRHWGLRVYCVATGAELTDKAGKVIATIVGLKDELYLDDLRDKVRRGMLGQVQRGLSPGSRPYGYRSEPIVDPKKRDAYGRPLVVGSRRVVDPEQATVVRRIFELYAQGYSAKRIAGWLNEQRIAPPRGHRRGWTHTTISGQAQLDNGILRNPLYVGRQVWNRVQKLRDPDTGRRIWRRRPRQEWITVQVPKLRIVTDELWNAVQARLRAARARNAAGRTGRPPKHLLSGHLICDACGAPYTIVGGGRDHGRGPYRYYGCSARTNRGPAVCQNTMVVRLDVLEDQILGLVRDRLLAPDVVQRWVEAFNVHVRRLLEDEARSNDAGRAELVRAERELENIKAAIRAGRGTPASLVAMLEEAEAKIARLRGRTAQAGTPRRHLIVHPQEALKYVHDLRRTVAGDPARARVVLQQAIEPIRLRAKGDQLIAVVRGSVTGILRLVCTVSV